MIFPLTAFNAPLGTTLSFQPMFGVCSVKTNQVSTETAEADVKTESGLIWLAERCEAVTGPDRKLDAEIAVATGEQSQAHELLMAGRKEGEERGPYDVMVRYYTTSVDAALTLVPEGQTGAFDPHFMDDEGEIRFMGYCFKPDWARWTPHGDWVTRSHGELAATAALAVCAAALRARAA